MCHNATTRYLIASIVALCSLSACASTPSLGRARSLRRYSESEALLEARRVAQVDKGPRGQEAAKLATEISIKLSSLKGAADDYHQYYSISRKHNWPLLQKYCHAVVLRALRAWSEKDRESAFHFMSQNSSIEQTEKLIRLALSSTNSELRRLGRQLLLSSPKSQSKQPLISKVEAQIVDAMRIKAKLTEDKASFVQGSPYFKLIDFNAQQDLIDDAETLFQPSLKLKTTEARQVHALATEIVSQPKLVFELRVFAAQFLLAKNKMTLSEILKSNFANIESEVLRTVLSDQKLKSDDISGFKTWQELARYCQNHSVQFAKFLRLYDEMTAPRIARLRLFGLSMSTKSFVGIIKNLDSAKLSFAAKQAIFELLYEIKKDHTNENINWPRFVHKFSIVNLVTTSGSSRSMSLWEFTNSVKNYELNELKNLVEVSNTEAVRRLALVSWIKSSHQTVEFWLQIASRYELLAEPIIETLWKSKPKSRAQLIEAIHGNQIVHEKILRFVAKRQAEAVAKTIIERHKKIDNSLSASSDREKLHSVVITALESGVSLPSLMLRETLAAIVLDWSRPHNTQGPKNGGARLRAAMSLIEYRKQNTSVKLKPNRSWQRHKD